MKVRLYEIDGVTLVASTEVPGLDDVPKVALWEDRAFLLRSVLVTADEARYAETVALRLELAAGVCQ